MRRPLLAAVLLGGCGVSPLSNRLDPGNEPIVIGVGEGADGHTDLFAASAGGGRFYQLTFTGAEERAPRLSPDGRQVAFLRRNPAGTDTNWTVVRLDLSSGRERLESVPRGTPPSRLAWEPGGASVVLGFGADSATREWLGDPPSAWIERCRDEGLCAVTRTGERSALGRGVVEAVRWGGDSVALHTEAGWEVRPLRGGFSRKPAWQGTPARLRELTYHAGAGTAAPRPSGIR